MLMEDMSRNISFQVRISHILHFIPICVLFTVSPTFFLSDIDNTHRSLKVQNLLIYLIILEIFQNQLHAECTNHLYNII
jgi:uncharacterized membrane protein